MARAIQNARKVFQVSARGGDGPESGYGWLHSEIRKSREAAFA
jgi:hypothetical protein